MFSLISIRYDTAKRKREAYAVQNRRLSQSDFVLVMFYTDAFWTEARQDEAIRLVRTGTRPRQAETMRLVGGVNVRWPVSRVLFRRSGDDHSSRRSVTGSLKQPTRVAVRIPDLSGKPDVPPLFGFAPGGVCRADPVAGIAVRSYRTVSPLPAPLARNRRSVFCGTFPGVAPAGRYPAPCFRGARTFLPRACARRRPSGHLTRPVWTPMTAASRLR